MQSLLIKGQQGCCSLSSRKVYKTCPVCEALMRGRSRGKEKDRQPHPADKTFPLSKMGGQRPPSAASLFILITLFTGLSCWCCYWKPGFWVINLTWFFLSLINSCSCPHYFLSCPNSLVTLCSPVGPVQCELPVAPAAHRKPGSLKEEAFILIMVLEAGSPTWRCQPRCTPSEGSRGQSLWPLPAFGGPGVPGLVVPSPPSLPPSHGSSSVCTTSTSLSHKLLDNPGRSHFKTLYLITSSKALSKCEP